MNNIKNLKYINTGVVFQEIPCETTLSINISNCPCHCPGCHSTYLWEDTGNILDINEINKLMDKYNGFITCICFMGGDNNPDEVNELAEYIKNHFNIKTAWYSGRDTISDKINISNFDYIKIGPYIEKYGGLNKKTTNQILYKNINNKLENITYMFWKNNI